MSLLWQILSLISLLVTVENLENPRSKVYTEIIRSFFHWKQINNGYLFPCPNLDSREMIKSLSKDSLEIGIVGKTNRRIDYFRKNHHIGFLLDLECFNVSNLHNYNFYKLFTRSEHWLILDELNQSTQFLMNFNLTIDTNVFLLRKVRWTNGPSRWIMEEVYNAVNPRFKMQLQINALGFWEQEGGFVVTDLRNKYQRRKDLQQVLLRSAIVLPEILHLKIPAVDFIKVEDDKNGNDIRSLLRYHFRVIENCGAMYNLRFKIKRLTSWGYLENGVWTGLSGAVAYHLIDISHTAVYIRQDRLTVGPFAPSGSYPTQNAFVFRHPVANTGGLNTFIRPITWTAWEATIILLILILFSMIISFWVEKRVLKIMGYGALNDTEMSSLVLMMVESFTQQGLDNTPVLYSGRTIVASFLIFCLVFYQFYSASILSSLLMKPPKSINTLEKLLHSGLKIGMEPQVYFKEWFMLTNDTVEKKLYQRILGNSKSSNIINYLSGLSKVLKGGFAYLTLINNADDMVGKTWSQNAICDYSHVSMREPQRLWQHFPEGSGYYKIVVLGVMTQMERGIISYQTIKWRARKPVCALELKDLTKAVKMGELMSAFFVLLLGMITSLVSLAYECLVRKRAGQKKLTNSSLLK